MSFEFTGEVKPPANVLASRYASPEMVALFSEDAKVFFERGLWIEVMRGQFELGAGVPLTEEAIADYECVQGDIDHASMFEREQLSHHDVNARIEEFNALAGHQLAHAGMTSRDLTENIEQYQIRLALGIMHDRAVATLARFATRAIEYSELPLSGRSHNVAAQTITVGKRFANFGEELLHSYHRFADLRSRYPLRGIKGPVGTQQDMLDLFEGDSGKVKELEARVARCLGFSAVFGSVGQVYPRSMDLDVVTSLQQLSAGPASFATTLRLMAGQELATEGFKPGQVGSSAMPHKMNATKAERIYSLNALLAGYATTASMLSGHQWNEGDVSCSAARRVVMPDSFFVADGIFQATMTILDGFGAYPAIIERELARYIPFLASTKFLMAAVKAGVGREDAHRIIKKHAVAVALEMREQGTTDNDLVDRLAADQDLGVSKDQLVDTLGNPLKLTGMARDQVGDFVRRVEAIVETFPKAAGYKPALKV